MEKNEDIHIAQKELMELTIKAARRVLHDFDHLLNEVQAVEIRNEFRERARMWKTIFYPDDGNKNYRSKLHYVISELEMKVSAAHKLLKDNNIDPEPDKPF
jgi:hypothetical protein